MNEYTWIHIAVGIDMKISFAACNASADIFSIILEIHGKQRLGRTVFTDLFVHAGSLLRCRKQFNACIISDRHIMEEPYEICPFIDHQVIEFL